MKKETRTENSFTTYGMPTKGTVWFWNWVGKELEDLRRRWGFRPNRTNG